LTSDSITIGLGAEIRYRELEEVMGSNVNVGHASDLGEE